MSEGQRILVGFDGTAASCDALHLARAFAQIMNGRLELATVLLHHPLESRALADPDDAADYFRRVFGKAREELPGVPLSRWELQASDFSAARALVHLAEREGVDLVVVGSAHRGALGRVMPGSLGRLVEVAPCPVATAPGGFADGERFRHGVVGVGYRGPNASAVALEWSQQLALALDAKLRIIATERSPAFEWVGGEPAVVGDERLEEAVEEAADWARNELEVEVVFEERESAAVLSTHGEELDLLVLGERRHARLRRTLLPGVSGRLARAAPCPLVVVRNDIPRHAVRFQPIAASATWGD